MIKFFNVFFSSKFCNFEVKIQIFIKKINLTKNKT